MYNVWIWQESISAGMDFGRMENADSGIEQS